MPKATVRASLPKLFLAADYHEFDQLQYDLNQILDTPVRVEQFGLTTCGRYVGVIYKDVRPTQLEIENMLENKNIHLD